MMLWARMLAKLTVIMSMIVAGCGNRQLGSDASGRLMPELVSAKALSRHYVDVMFAGPVGDAGAVAGNYTITTPDGAKLSVHTAKLQPDNQVLLTTDPQEPVPYQLVFNTAPVTGTGETAAAFVGSAQPEPIVESAIALDATTVLLTFSEAMDAATTTVASYYRIADPDGDRDIDIQITEVTTDTDPSLILVHTTPQENIEYEIIVTNVTSKRDRFLINPTRNRATFSGIPPVDTTPPQVIGATAISKTAVLVSFNEPLNNESDDPLRFSIFPELVVSAAEQTKYQTQMILTTLPQVPDREYSVTVVGVQDRADNWIDPTANTATFRGTARELYLHSAVALSNSSVLVTYSEPPDPNTALSTSFYSIDDPDGDIDVDIRILEAEPDPQDPRAVILTTTPQENILYRLRATNIRAIRDNFLIDPTRNTTTFFGIAAEDFVGPTLLGAASMDNTAVVLTFSEPLDGDAADPVNFGITCTECDSESLLVVEAFITRHNTQILLTTHPQTTGAEYTVTVTNVNGQVTDLSVNHNPIDPDPSMATFTFAGQPMLVPGMVLPRVVGAISLGNTLVMVTFNKPMGDSALTASSYSIVQENVNAEVGALFVLDNICDPASVNAGEYCTEDAECDGGSCILRAPQFSGGDRTAVVLTTSSQNEVTYRVRVVNVKDLAGNQLASAELLVDPGSATFAGTPPTGDEFVDSDGDGLTDDFEVRGRIILVVLSNGEVIEIEVTSSPFDADTDDDGLSDFVERRVGSNPRSRDTDGDQIEDYEEFSVWYTSSTNQDTDADGVNDYSELFVFKTSPKFEDTDGDGLTDGAEISRGNRDPRIADLPDPGIEIGQVALRLDTRFAYTDTQGESQSVGKTTSSTLSQSESRTFSTSDTSTTEHAISASTEFGYEGGFEGGHFVSKGSFKAQVGYSYTRGNTFTTSEQSTEAAQSQYQESLSTNVSRDVTQSVTRTVQGAAVEALVTINNRGDIPFTVRNIQLTGLLQDPFNRRSFLPVATLLPASMLEGGGDLEVFLGPFIPERGPFVFKNTEVFPSLVEDLMKNPRGLIFTVANFDIEDEDGRSFAFISQDVNDRTAGIIIDYGNGAVDRFRVTTHSPFEDGEPTGITMAYALQDILSLEKNASTNAITVGPNGCGETWAVGDDIQVAAPLCFPVPVGGLIIEPGPNGVLDTIPAGDDVVSSSTIIDGGDGCAHTRAARDDVQRVPGDCESAFPDGIMVLPGANGTFETTPAGDDEEAAVTGYGTELIGACDGDTTTQISGGEDGTLNTAPQGDDVTSAGVILAGPNDVFETSPEGDDVLEGPGQVCESDSDCPGAGRCRDTERLTRVKGVQDVPEERRFWIILTDTDVPPGTDFDDIVLRAGNTFSLAYVQDRDDDGLIAHEEFLYGSSDREPNSDRCPLGDGADGCDQAVYDFDTIRDFDEVKRGWTVEVEGRRSYPVFSNPVQPDTDADRIFDDREQILGTDPGKRDSDDDDISDFAEVEGYDILRRDDVLIRHVFPYQSAFIHPGDNGELDTPPGGDDELTVHAGVFEIITAGENGKIDSFAKEDDLLETTHSASNVPAGAILDGGNGIPQTEASGDDEQVGPSPDSTTTVTVTFLEYAANGDACDELQSGEFTFDLLVRKNIDAIREEFLQDAPVSRFSAHSFDGVILAGPNAIADTSAVGDDEQLVAVGETPDTDGIIIRPGPNGLLDTTTPSGDDVMFGPGDGDNSITLTLEPGDTLSLSGTVIERDDVCDADTRQAVVEAGLAIVEPLTGGNGTADTEVPKNAEGHALNDDIQEVALGDPVTAGQVVISAGPNGILDTTTTGGDDVIPAGNGFADTLATGDDEQVVELGDPVSAGGAIVLCGADGEPAMGMSPAVPGICEAVIIRIATGDGTADSVAAGDDIQVKDPGDPVVEGDVIVRAGPNGVIDTVPTGASEEVEAAQPPFACEAVIAQDSGASGVAETSASGDDVQAVAVGIAAAAGEVIIEPGANGVVDSNVASQVIVEPNTFGDGIADAAVAAATDDIQVVPVGSMVSAGQLIIAPGPNGVLDSPTAGDDVIDSSDDELIEAHVPAGLVCSDCPLGSCGIDCTVCATGQCVGDDALLVRSSGQSCEDGFCPCGACVTGTIAEWPLQPKSYTLDDLISLTAGDGSFIVTFSDGETCFDNAELTALVDVSAGVTVTPGAILVHAGANGVLDTSPEGDDYVGAPHVTFFATDPLSRDTDADTLFDGAEVSLGADPNNPLDASKYRDNDLDGLANIEETEGWFIGVADDSGLRCRVADGTFIEVDDEFDPPPACEFVVSDRFEPDSDFDGLPDLLERLIRSDPLNRDTDGDGLLDYDEFDPESRFSIDIGLFREFERRCFEADRCTFTPLQGAFGTSVVLADTDEDGRDDRTELRESWVINPCIGDEQLPIEVSSDPLSPDIDHDGVLDGDEQAQGTDPRDPDTDDDGQVDNPSIDPVPDGCGRIVKISFFEYKVGDDDCDGTGDGEYEFDFTVVTPQGNFDYSQDNDDLDDNETHTFSSNSAHFILRPGETFKITGEVKEIDGPGNADEYWEFERPYSYESLPDSPISISPRSGDEDNDNCFDDHKLKVNIAVSQA